MGWESAWRQGGLNARDLNGQHTLPRTEGRTEEDERERNEEVERKPRRVFVKKETGGGVRSRRGRGEEEERLRGHRMEMDLCSYTRQGVEGNSS